MQTGALSAFNFPRQLSVTHVIGMTRMDSLLYPLVNLMTLDNVIFPKTHLKDALRVLWDGLRLKSFFFC